MKTFIKIAVIVVCLGAVISLALCLTACNKQSPDIGYTGSSGRFGWNEYEGLSFCYINAKDCEGGKIDLDKVRSQMQFELGNTYYMVIDFTIQAERDNNGTSRLHTKLELEPASAIKATIQEAATSEFKEEVLDKKINISLSYKIPELAETVKRMRLVIQLRPVLSSDIKLKLFFESENNLNAVKTTLAEDVIFGDYTQDLDYIKTIDGGYAVSKGPISEQIVIPIFRNDRYITSIGDNAFYNYDVLKSIIIPDSVTSIGDSAFFGCSLNYNEYDNGLYLGNKNNPYLVLVKAKDEKITSCEINGNTKFIRSKAFYNCSSLKSITIPNSVTSIGDDAFFNCSSLKYNEYNNGLYIGNDENPYLVLVAVKDKSIKNFEINDNTMFIHSQGFSDCDSLTSVSIPDSVTSIGSSTFSNCSSLTSIALPNTVTTIGKGVFSDCNSLKYNEYNNGLYLGNDKNPYLIFVKSKDKIVTSFEVNSNTKFVHSGAFSECSSLTSITLPFVGAQIDGSSNTHFGYIFGASGSLKNEDYVPSSLKEVIITGNSSIWNESFLNCTSITNVSIGNSVISIGFSAFKGCSSLTSITLPFVGAQRSGSSNTHFGYIFGANRYLRNINYVPDSLKEVIITGGSNIDDNAFFYCSSLISVTMPDSLTKIGGYAFQECSSLISITIPDSVTSIGYRAFQECSSLTSVTIGNSVTTISEWAFRKCSSLTNITIGNNVTTIDKCAFLGCSSLTNIVIPNSVTTIGDCAFEDCRSLKNITLPNSVTSIGMLAFEGCSLLTSINFEGTKSEWETISISNLYYSSKINVVHCTDGDVNV